MPHLGDFVGETFESDGDSSIGEDGESGLVPHREEPGMKCESKRLYEKEDNYGCVQWVDEIPDKFMDPAYDREAWSEFALLLRTQLVDGKQRLYSIVVQSPLLKTALKRIFAHYPGFFVGKNPLEMEAPFKPFVHRWDAFVRACEMGNLSDTTRHLQLLKSALEPELQETFAAISDFKVHGAIEFDQLWMIFNPGSLVFCEEDETECAFKLMRTEVRGSMEEKRKYFVLHCCQVDYDGKKFGHALHMLAIAQFEGSSNYKDLGVYPLESHPAKESVILRLIEKGRKFEGYAGVHYRAYDGTAKDCAGGLGGQHVNGRIVIDSKTYLKFNSWLNPNLGSLDVTEDLNTDDLDNDYRRTDGSYAYEQMYNNMHQLRTDAMTGAANRSSDQKDVKLTDEQLMICKRRVRGYSLKLKKWLEFEIDSVKMIRWNATAFNSLELPGNYKHMLLAFAKSQRSAAAQFDDVIEGKGRGMVMLLEGPPGVGKTLTVESVAEEMQAPLYSIAAGQLKTDAASVQRELLDAFEIATTWNAIILLDEADIFLERRSVHDLERNQLVSVFLQYLEYFEGTIFLTTNRVECIDPAFKSRIHASVKYPELTSESRRRVWENFIKTLQMDTSEFTDAAFNRFAAYELNGRQIKNVVKMAGLLAAADNGQLKPTHVEAMMKIIQSDEGGSGVTS